MASRGQEQLRVSLLVLSPKLRICMKLQSLQQVNLSFKKKTCKNENNKWNKILGWAFIIWTPIFLWLAINFIIINTVFWLKNGKYERLYFNPLVFSNSFLAVLMLNFLLNTTWIFISDRSTIWISHQFLRTKPIRSIEDTGLVGLSSAWLFLIAITNVMATAILARNIASYNDRFRRHQELFVWGIVYRYNVSWSASFCKR